MDLRDFVDRRLHARRHVADAPQGFWHGVGGFPEGDQLAAGIGQFGELERRLGTELPEFCQRLLGLGRITDQSGECHLRLLEVGGGGDRLHADAHCGGSTRQGRADARLERNPAHLKPLAKRRRATLAKSGQPRARHFPHAAGGCGDKFGGTGQRPLQGGDVGSKRDSEGAHAPGAESTEIRTSSPPTPDRGRVFAGGLRL
ncbi:MAG: hypothetical protein NTW21_35455 [Verrucomicrobia bacterium]|nr:hypothetical protein [Verrucomicrobiota bacterium]